MTQTELEALITEVVNKVQTLSGRETVAITSSTRPVNDVPEFDSLNGVEATIEIMERLKIDLEFNNVLVDKATALTVEEAAQRLLPLVNKK